VTDAEQLTLFLAPSIAPISDEWLRCCNDCLADVVEIGERYMVHDHVWPVTEDGGALCVGCLEKRIGRRLVPGDFTDCWGNRGAWPQSERLRSRMIGASEGGSESDVGPPDA
jgi:hypothetical protein